MQAIFETIFHICYLTTVITLGYKMYQNKMQNQYFKGYGIMAMVLGFGDAFHLIPRIYALWTTGLEANYVALGFGKFITSITMTFFYLIFYKLFKMKAKQTLSSGIDFVIYGMAFLRILISLFPQNGWLTSEPSFVWGIYRNIPFTIMGIVLIWLLYREGKIQKKKDYKTLSICVFLSFLFYIPVVLYSRAIPQVGMLMVPKTIAYVYIVYIGYRQMKCKNLTMSPLK